MCLFGNSVLQINSVEMRFCWVRVALHAARLVYLSGKTATRGEGHVKAGAEPGEMRPQAQGRQQPRKLGSEVPRSLRREQHSPPPTP